MAFGTPKLREVCHVTTALIQWLADCQIENLQPIPLRSVVLPRLGAGGGGNPSHCVEPLALLDTARTQLDIMRVCSLAP